MMFAIINPLRISNMKTTIDNGASAEVHDDADSNKFVGALGNVAINVSQTSEVTQADADGKAGSLAKMPNMTEIIDATMGKFLTAGESEEIREDLIRADAASMNTIGMTLRNGGRFKPEMAETMAQMRNVTGELSIRVENLTPGELSELHDLIYKPYETASIKARQEALSELVARIRAVGGQAGDEALGGRRLARIEARINDNKLWTVGEVKMPLDVDGLLGGGSFDSFYFRDNDRNALLREYQRSQDVDDFLRAKGQVYSNTTARDIWSNEASLESDDWQARLAESNDYDEDMLYSEVQMLQMLAPYVREVNDTATGDDAQSSQEYSEFYNRLNELVADDLIDEGEFYVPGTCLSANDMDYIFQCVSRAKIPLTQNNRLGDGQTGVLKDIFGRCRQLIRSDQLMSDTALTTLVIFNYARDKIVPERILKPRNLLLLSVSSCKDLRDTIDQLRNDFKHADDSRVALAKIGEASSRLHDSTRYLIELLRLDQEGIKGLYGQSYPSSSEFYDFLLAEIRGKSDADMAKMAKEHVLALIKLDEHMRKNFGRNIDVHYIEARKHQQPDDGGHNLEISPDSALPAANLSDIFSFDDGETYE